MNSSQAYRSDSTRRRRSLLDGTRLAVPILLMLLIPNTGAAGANYEARGCINTVNRHARSIALRHASYDASSSTDYGNGLNGFRDLRIGQNVVIRFHRRAGHRTIDAIGRTHD